MRVPFRQVRQVVFGERPRAVLGWMLVASVMFAAAASAQLRLPSTDGGLTETADDVARLKQEVLELERDLMTVEEIVAFPASTRLTVFLSADVGEFFQLEAVELSVDDRLVTTHFYGPEERRALERGAVHQVYRGNHSPGRHELVAVFTGKGPKGREYRRATRYSFEKNSDPRFIEIRIKDQVKTLQPEFEVTQW